MSYTLHPEAEAELMERAAYLSEKVTPRVANAFLDEFARVADIVELNPDLGTPEAGGLRSFPSLKFKFSLIYFDTESGPLILAVAPHKREPGYWRTRL